jgi:2-C-methyl-D-erythritol 4-phosphate cytidylyltransferase
VRARRCDRRGGTAGWEEPSILLAEELAASKVVACVTGGTTRAQSVARRSARFPTARSSCSCTTRRDRWSSDAVVERIVGPSGGFDGAVPALPVADTLKRVETVSSRRPSTVRARAAQTPQAFSRTLLRKAFAGQIAGATDCASLVERAAAAWRRRGRPAAAQGHDAGDLALVESWL